MQPLSRRSALRGGTTVALAAAVGTIPDIASALQADDDLVRLYAEWQRWTERSERNSAAMRGASNAEIRALEDEIAAIEKERQKLEYAIAAVPATTMAGVRLKLGLAAYWIEQGGDAEYLVEHALALAAHHDLERLAEGGVS